MRITLFALLAVQSAGRFVRVRSVSSRFAFGLLAAGWGLALPACTPAVPPPEVPQEVDLWEPASSVIQSGDVQVSVVRTGVEPVQAIGLEVTQAFVVRVSLTNTNPTHRLEYRTWADGVSLRDNFGNTYRALARPVGLGVLRSPLDPGKPVVDVLVFEAPSRPPPTSISTCRRRTGAARAPWRSASGW